MKNFHHFNLKIRKNDSFFFVVITPCYLIGEYLRCGGNTVSTQYSMFVSRNHKLCIN